VIKIHSVYCPMLSHNNCPVPQLTILTHATMCVTAKPLCEANWLLYRCPWVVTCCE